MVKDNQLSPQEVQLNTKKKVQSDRAPNTKNIRTKYVKKHKLVTFKPQMGYSLRNIEPQQNLFKKQNKNVYLISQIRQFRSYLRKIELLKKKTAFKVFFNIKFCYLSSFVEQNWLAKPDKFFFIAWGPLASAAWSSGQIFGITFTTIITIVIIIIVIETFEINFLSLGIKKNSLF